MTAAGNTTLICTAWKPFERNTLKGFADLWLRSARKGRPALRRDASRVFHQSRLTLTARHGRAGTH